MKLKNKKRGLVKAGYQEFLVELKNKIRSAQIKAALTVNSQLIRLYWEIGKSILDKQNKAAWGDKVIENISKDLSSAFPEMKGFSVSNLKYMKRFSEEYPKLKIGQQLADQLPWWHNDILHSSQPFKSILDKNIYTGIIKPI